MEDHRISPLPRKVLLARRIGRLRSRFADGGAGGVLRGMATLALGAGMARVVGIAVIPILTRLYTPEEYGVLAAFTALILVVTPLMGLCYGMALPLPRRDETAMNLLLLAGLITLVMTLGMALALWFGAPALLGLISMEAMIPWWWLLPLGMLGAGLFETMSFWATRRKAYRPLAQAQVIQTSLGAAAQVLLGLAGVKPAGLLIGHAIQRSAGTLSLGSIFGGEFRRLARQATLRRLLLAAHRHRAFPIFRLPSQLLTSISAQGPLLLASALYGAEDAGRLGLALMALGVPMAMFGLTMGRAYYAEIAALGPRRPAEIRALSRAVLKRISLVAAVPTLVLFCLGPSIFRIAFGAEWEEAGALASRLAIYLLGQFLWASISYILHVFEQERILIGLSLQRALLMALTFAVGYGLGLEITDTILLYSLLLTTHYAVCIYRTLHKIPA
jgi:O-antigen/teichoic acid export membrane protein|tara:strand:+ start:28167 stop:29501 length:1335 start_codon:yes stop_codon:yes gene_type:complete